MLTRKAAITVAFALWLFTLGLVLRNGLLSLSAIPVVGYVVLLEMLDPRPHLEVTVERSSQSEVTYEGGEGVVTLTVRNRGAPLANLEVLDGVPDSLVVSKGSNHTVGPLGRGMVRSMSYAVRAPVFGSYQLGPVSLRSTDASRDHAEEKTVQVAFDLWVYPEISYLSRMSIRPHTPKNWPGETATRRAGSGMDFYGIREYLPGEAFRRLNWKASARTERLMINNYIDESGGDIMLVLDSRLASEVGAPPDSILTLSTRAAAAIAYRLLRDRNRVGLIGIGDNFVRVLPGFGRRQYERLLASLLVLKPGDGWEIGTLPKLLSLHFSRQTQIVVFSSLLDDKAYEAIVETANAGYHVIVLSPSAVDLEAGRTAVASVEERAALRLAHLERESRLSQLSGYALVLDWDPNRPLGEAMQSLAEVASRR